MMKKLAKWGEKEKEEVEEEVVGLARSGGDSFLIKTDGQKNSSSPSS